MGDYAPGWYYVGNGQVRYMDDDGWTDQYNDIDPPKKTAEEMALAETEAEALRHAPPPRPRRSTLLQFVVAVALIAVACTGAAAVATGALNPGELLTSAMAGSSKTADTTATVANETVRRPRGGLDSAVGKTPFAPRSASTSEGRAHTKAMYAGHVGDVPLWIARVRDSYRKGYEASVGTTLGALSHRFEEVAMLPPPPKVDPVFWAAKTDALSRMTRQAAAEWAGEDYSAAMAHFETTVKGSNVLVAKINAGFGLRIPLSGTAG